jgi:GNAT superfamily N-acetyltransferase
VATTRIWSDGAYEAKLYDVVTARDLMGQGIASALVTWALKHPAVSDVQRFVLDRLYGRFGFQDPCAPDGRGLGRA